VAGWTPEPAVISHFGLRYRRDSDKLKILPKKQFLSYHYHTSCVRHVYFGKPRCITKRSHVISSCLNCNKLKFSKYEIFTEKKFFDMLVHHKSDLTEKKYCHYIFMCFENRTALSTETLVTPSRKMVFLSATANNSDCSIKNRQNGSPRQGFLVCIVPLVPSSIHLATSHISMLFCSSFENAQRHHRLGGT
jgi:hypothetical protein